jgi:hypothetical protein
MDLTAALEDMLRVIERLGREVCGGPSVLRLSDAIEARMPVEESGLAESDIYELQAKPLSPRNPFPHRNRDIEFIGIDSSSRRIDAPQASIVVSAVSMSWGAFELLDWPPIYRSLKLVGPPFIRILPNAEGTLLADSLQWVDFRNPAGLPYDRDYSVAQAMDEARVFLENWSLLEPLHSIAKSTDKNFVVLVDGPLYLVPGALAGVGAPEKYVEAWRFLLLSRIEAVRALEDMGVPVMGVVKRLSRSRILSRTPQLSATISKCIGLKEFNDENALYLLYRSGCTKRRPGFIYKTPKIKVRSSLGEEVDKIVEYLVLPPGRLQDPSGMGRMVRIEYTEKSLEIIRSWGLEPYQVYAMASLASDSLLPLSIQASDRRARMITKVLKHTISSLLVSRGAILDYEDLSEVEVRWPGMRA